MTLKKMQKMKKGKVLIAIPEKCMYLSKRASLIFGSEPDFCRGQDGATSSSTTAHLRWVHLWKRMCMNQHSYKSYRFYILPLLFQLQLTNHQMGSKTHPNSDRTICPTHGSTSQYPQPGQRDLFPLFYLISPGTHCGAE